MNTREHFLFRIAEDDAKDKYGSLDLSMDQWARIYDHVENDFQKYDLKALRDYVGLEWPQPFSLSAWYADFEFDCDDCLSGEDWQKLDDHVAMHLAHFTTGGLFRRSKRPAHGSGGGAALAQ